MKTQLLYLFISKHILNELTATVTLMRKTNKVKVSFTYYVYNLFKNAEQIYRRSEVYNLTDFL